MQLVVKGKHLDVGDALRTHVAENLTALVGKFFVKPMEATVVFSRDGQGFKADIQVRVGRGIVLQSQAAADEPYPAFEAACEKLHKRLRRYKDRLRGHHTGEAEAEELIPARYQVLEAEREDHLEELAPANGKAHPVVVADMQMHIDTLTVGEAVMRMELAEAPALMFRNRGTGGLNMVYRRADGNVGWVDPALEAAGA